MREGWVALIAFVVGTTSGVLWSHWRHQVVQELRRIRVLLEDEQEPTLRAIRDHLYAAAGPPPDEGVPSPPEIEGRSSGHPGGD
jgi:hypothetical protein